MNNENELLEINPAYADYPAKEYGWIYIAVDMRDLCLSKIGLTTQETPSLRIAEGRTYNPFLTLFTTYELAKCTFGVSHQELRDIEGYIHSKKTLLGNPLKHLESMRDSEWFMTPPYHAEGQVDWVLAKRGFSVDHEDLYEHYDTSNNRNGINVRAMGKIKKIYRPHPEEVQYLVQSAGYDPRLIRPYLNYLEEFHTHGHPDQIWL